MISVLVQNLKGLKSFGIKLKIADHILLYTICLSAIFWQGCASSRTTIATSDEQGADQATLEKIATEDASLGARAAAITKLSDQEVLMKLAEISDPNGSEVVEAAARVQLALLDPVVVARVPEARLFVAYNTTLANYVGGPPVTGETIRFTILQHSKTLASCVWSTTFAGREFIPTTFRPAIINLSDILPQLFCQPEFSPDDLYQLSQSKITETARCALSQIVDQAVLAKIAMDGKDRDVREAAIDKLTNQALIAKGLYQEPDFFLRMAYVGVLTDETLLARIAVGDKDSTVRGTAIWRLSDKNLLAKIAVDDEDSNNRSLAAYQLRILAEIEKITDQEKLGKIEIGGDDFDLVIASIKKLKGQALLAKIAMEDSNPSFRGTAVIQLTDQVILGKIAVTDSASAVRDDAVERLTDQRLLGRIAATDSEYHVRSDAQDRLNQLREGLR
jgi:hypothetical protein